MFVEDGLKYEKSGVIMRKLLILSIYPAPYRVELFRRFTKIFETDVYFEHSQGDARSKEWFSKGNYYLLDTESGATAYKKSLKNIKQYSAIGVYDYSSREGIKLIVMAIVKKIPYVVNSDGVMLVAHGNQVKNIAKRILLSKARAFLASGEMAKKYFMDLGAAKEKIYTHTFTTLNKEDILSAPLSHEDKLALRRKLKLPEDGHIVIAVGRFIPLKRYSELIEAWIDMPQDYFLQLIGGGEEVVNYRKCIEKNHLNNVMIEGFHPKNELFEYYKAADVFVHPTSYDVWGLVINEAMACGLPVVVSDHCVAGLELVRNHENGYLIKMGNDVEMCDRVRQICEDNNLHSKMTQNALQTIKSYTLEHMAETHIQAFKEITNNDKCNYKRR